MNKTQVLSLSFVLGFITLGTQILVYREFMVAFNGNEQSVALVIAGWLFWGAIGSATVRNLPSKDNAVRMMRHFSVLFVLSPMLIASSKFLRLIWGLTPGETAGNLPIILSSFLFTALPCVISGRLFPILAEYSIDFIGVSSIDIYVVEAAGSIFISILLRVAFASAVTGFNAAFILSALGFFLLGFIVKSDRARVSLIFLSILLFVLVFSGIAEQLEWMAEQSMFPGFQIETIKETPYGRMHVLRRSEELSLYSSGVLVFSSTDFQSFEEIAHLPLAQHADPRTVLLLGDASMQVINKILMHPIQQLTAVFQDEAFPQIATLLDQQSKANAREDPRLLIKIADPVKFIQSLPEDNFDVIISCLPEPFSFSSNRNRSLEFLEEIYRILKRGGIFSMRARSSENFLGETQKKYLAGTMMTVRQAFPKSKINIFPGDSADIFVTKAAEYSAPDANLILKTLRERNIDSFYISEGYLPFRLDPSRVEALEKDILSERSTEVNRQYSTSLTRNSLRLWQEQFTPDASIEIIFTSLCLSVIFLSFIILIPVYWKHLRSDFAIGLCVAVIGAAQIITEVVFIYIQQINNGTAYLKTGLLIGVFNAGLAYGAFIASRIRQRTNNIKLFLVIQFALSILCGITVFIIKSELPLSEFHVNILAFVTGGMGGFLFAISLKVRNAPGVLYSADLLGSAGGAICLATFMAIGLSVSLILILVSFFLVLTGVIASLKQAYGDQYEAT